MGASLRAGLAALEEGEAALVHLVDLPDVTAAVVGRLLVAPVGAATLRRAAYAGVPGHPVLLGRDHWAGVAATAVGDRGARDYLRTHRPELVECGDLATGADVDVPAAPALGDPTRDQPAAE
jgi:nicotine blue oxidoreductase